MNNSFAPAVSIIVPVLNESDIIENTVIHLTEACSGHAEEIIIVDGDPSGSTIRRVKSKQILTITAPPGRAKQMNAGAEAARGGVLLFVHADTLLPRGALRDILDACRRPEIAAGAIFSALTAEKGFSGLLKPLRTSGATSPASRTETRRYFSKRKSSCILAGMPAYPSWKT